MLVSRLTPINVIEIWQPRWKDRTVLLAQYKVKEFNKVKFTKAKNLIGRDFYISGAKVRTFPIDDNGKIACYAVPLDELEVLEYKEDILKTIDELFPV